MRVFKDQLAKMRLKRDGLWVRGVDLKFPERW
jgi:hypothetical protein